MWTTLHSTPPILGWPLRKRSHMTFVAVSPHKFRCVLIMSGLHYACIFAMWPWCKMSCICCILNKPLSESGSPKYTRRNDDISKHENHNYRRFLLTFISLLSRRVFIKVKRIRTSATIETIGILITMELLRSSGTGLCSIAGAKPLRVPMKNILPDSKVHGANMGPIWGR